MIDTIIRWRDVSVELPPKYINASGKLAIKRTQTEIFSSRVLFTDGYGLYYGGCVLNWEEEEYDGLVWREDEICYEEVDNVVAWCALSDFSLPQPKDNDTEGRYTLKQLRQAWAAGRFCGAKE